MKIQNKLNEIVKMIKKDKDVLAVMLFGSFAEGKENPMSDIDICVFLKTNFKNKYRMGEKRLMYLMHAPDKFDIQIFQLLPLYIKIKILGKGKMVYCRNLKELYQVAYETIQDYNFFKPAYEDYIKAIR